MSKSSKSKVAAKQFAARAAWSMQELDEHFSTILTQAIMRGDEISLQWPPVNGVTTQTVLSRTSGSKFKGQSIASPHTPDESIADVNAELFSNESGHVLVAEEISRETGAPCWYVIELRV